MRIAALSGGVGGARFLRGLLAALAQPAAGSDRPVVDDEPQVTVVGNTADDVTLHGLRVCPDLDSVMYTLGGGADDERGWGRAGETFAVAAELQAYGAEPAWFGLGDRDLATHLVRTQRLRAGHPLSEVTAALCERWRPGVRLLPATDDPVETHVVVDEADLLAAGADVSALGAGVGSAVDAGGLAGPGQRTLHFQEWWVRHHAAVPARTITVVGAETARAAPGVLEAIADADVVLLPPSNPVVSIGAVLAVPGIREALRATSAPVVGVSPVVGGAPVRGMADACLAAIGVETSAGAVAGLYADVLDAWLVDTADAGCEVPPRTRLRVEPLLMRTPEDAARIAAAALEEAAALTVVAPGPAALR